MRQKLKAVFIFICLCIMHIGCGAENAVYLEQAAEVSANESSTLETVGESVNTDGNFREEKSGESEETSGMSGQVSDAADMSDESKGVPEVSAVELEKTAEQKSQSVCYVYICGAVRQPGVYVLDSGSRIYEAVALAGGLTAEASAESVNQALEVSDGQMIRILTKEETAAGAGEIATNTNDSDSGQPTSADDSRSAQQADDGKININTASVSELMTLPGIGQKKAESIISYRESNGAFSDIEQIMSVDGIKEGVYNRVKEFIKVK